MICELDPCSTSIDEAMQSKDRLAVERRLLSTVLQQLPVGVSILGGDPPALTMFNDKMSKILGVPSGSTDVTAVSRHFTSAKIT